jgi:hypothetical protein
MSRQWPYISGWCSPSGTGHARCLGEYGTYAKATRCTCACHKAGGRHTDPAPLVADGQLVELLGGAPDAA